MKVVSRTLFSVWAKRPGADGQIPYDDFGEVTLSATSAECFPGVKFPSSSTDAQAARDFLLLIGLTHPVLRDMRDAKAFTSQGAVFLLLHGTIGFKVPHEELSRRLSVAMAITKRQGYLLTWFFAAPHDSELRQLLAERVKFDPVPMTEDASTPKAGSRGNLTKPVAEPATTGASSAKDSTSQPTAGSGSGTRTSLPGGGSTVESNPASTTASGSPQQNNPSTASSPTRPTLLRPGETMQGQQGNGAPVQKH